MVNFGSRMSKQRLGHLDGNASAASAVPYPCRSECVSTTLPCSSLGRCRNASDRREASGRSSRATGVRDFQGAWTQARVEPRRPDSAVGVARNPCRSWSANHQVERPASGLSRSKSSAPEFAQLGTAKAGHCAKDVEPTSISASDPPPMGAVRAVAIRVRSSVSVRGRRTYRRSACSLRRPMFPSS